VTGTGPRSGAAGQGAGPSRFSTLGLPDARRLELWEDYNTRSLVGLVCTTMNDAPLAATELNVWLPNLQFAHVTGTPHLVERTTRQIAAHPAEAVMLYITLAGEAFFYNQDEVRVLRPGEAVLYDADQPFARGFSRGLRELVLKIPYPVFEQTVGGAPQRTPRVIDVGRTATADGHGPALAALMSAALRGGDGQDPARAENDALALLGALLDGPAARDAGTAHLRAAQAYIERHLHDHRLSASRIATGIGISERQLSRVFSRQGSGVARWILDRRLESARRALTTVDGRASIAAVARDCGFSSQSYFTRAFRQRYAQTPTEARRDAVAAAPESAPR
jgi:AraC-like DNA-binding protein